MLFILDGFDELPTDLCHDSFLLELIQGKLLPECTVLVTSRPSATADLHYSCKSKIHKHIENSCSLKKAPQLHNVWHPRVL